MSRIPLALILMAGALAAQAPPNMPKADPLWPGAAPGAQGTQDEDQPTLAPYLVPQGRGTGTAVIVCPGGGYAQLSMDKEGDQVARWLNSMGVAAFVLKYRLGPQYHHPMELGRRAARHPHGALQGRGVPRAAGPHRHHGLLGRRPPGLHGRHAFRRGQRQPPPTPSTA